MFRRERPQKGRYRQFFQIGAEAIGSESPLVDAEVIEMVMEILERAGTRADSSCCSTRWATTIAGRSTSSGCARNCKAWRRRCAAIASGAPRPIRCACSIAKWKPTSRSSTSCPAFSITCASPAARTSTAVKQYLDDRGIAYEVRPRMVRGLDYYMRTTFEVVHGALGAQNSVLGGGRYDGLAESLGSKVHSPGIGFSIGEDRLVMSVEGEQTADAARSVHRAAGRAGRAPRRRAWRAISGAPGSRWNWWKAS